MIKRLFIPVLVLAASCSTSSVKSSRDTMADAPAAAAPEAQFLLEDLLKIPDEKALIAKFGAEHVKYDTLWGAEGAFDMGTYLDKGTKDEVQVLWRDSLNRAGVGTAMITAYYNSSDGSSSFENKWVSASGVKLGLTVKELEALNKGPFTFYGLDWDYGGGVNWGGGALSKTKPRVGVTLGHNNKEPQMSEADMDVLLGDHEVKSDDPVVRKAQPVVMQMNVWQE